jgi:hypothetical protein
MPGAADQQGDGVAHRAEVGADVDDVGDEQQRDDHPQQRFRIMGADVAGDALASDAADTSADPGSRPSGGRRTA